MLHISKIIVDAYGTMGKDCMLIAIMPENLYVDNKRTDTIVGYKYEVVLLGNGYEKLVVKIAGEKRLDVDFAEGGVPVEFIGLTMTQYYNREGKVAISAKATDIALVQTEN